MKVIEESVAYIGVDSLVGPRRGAVARGRGRRVQQRLVLPLAGRHH